MASDDARHITGSLLLIDGGQTLQSWSNAPQATNTRYIVRKHKVPEKILIDTDPGVDDSMAILMALHSPELQVVGLTSVFGNTDSDITAQNTLRLVEWEGNEHIPVAQGAGIPLVMPPRSTRANRSRQERHG